MKRFFGLSQRAQTFTEYAIIIGATVAFIGGISIYLQRALKAKIHESQTFVATQMQGDRQYEPYYVQSSSTNQSASGRNVSFKEDSPVMTVGGGSITITEFDSRTCAENGVCDPQ